MGSKKPASRTNKARSTAVGRPSAAGGRRTKKVAKRGAHRIAARGGSVGRRAASARAVYHFGPSGTDGDGSMKELLGGKGANLAEMTSIGLPVPPGFTITTATCAAYEKAGNRLPRGLMAEVRQHVARLERETGKRFGEVGARGGGKGGDRGGVRGGEWESPLLVSVRSGAAVSMPGMMDTVLNLGLTDETVEALAARTGNPRFAHDAYRRLIHMFGDVVKGVHHAHFEAEFRRVKQKWGASLDTDVPTAGMLELVERYKGVYRESVGEAFPQDPYEQLEEAIEAVFRSWMSPRAVSYRRIAEIRGLIGTAVNVQAMVYGNTGEASGTGVAFTRNPATGKNEFYGEFLVNAQGEDVVAGIRTPRPVSEMKSWNRRAHARLLEIKSILESHYRDMQDIEFTVEEGELYMLQTRTGKRTGTAAVNIACDMVAEGLITEEEALLRVPAKDLTQLLLPTFSEESKKNADVLTRGLPASPGAAVGRPAFTAAEAVERAKAGEAVILVRSETSPEDVEGMHSAVGILTSTGGMTSHAAVVARGWGKCCVAGAGEVRIDEAAGRFSVRGRSFGREDTISIDGSTGEVMAGAVEAPPPAISRSFARLMSWADRRARLRVRANADTPEDARRARELGAQGIGLCRTEHMFFEGERILHVREMILAENDEDRARALAKLLPWQRADFEGLFRAMHGLPVTIRLLDPPLHEFLPNDEGAQAEVARDLGVSPRAVRERVQQLREANPMLGHRGCRLAVTCPPILEMQVRAIVEAAIAVGRERIRARPEIMIPLVGTAEELRQLRELAVATIEKVRAERRYSGRLDIPVGTMIEVPRAAIAAEAIAGHADFFSFGTNDLTQLVFGYSRDDANSFLPAYLERNILPSDPFQTIDEGVAELVRIGIERGRRGRADLKIGICGEHGGDPASVRLCHQLGMDYVSCSPFRIPIARLAAAQAALLERKGEAKARPARKKRA